jgi:hypothetical protein
VGLSPPPASTTLLSRGPPIMRFEAIIVLLRKFPGGSSKPSYELDFP